MIDLHTHILPKMDDGASSSTLSLDMLRMEASQRVDTVVLTPHFYREEEEPEAFLQRRASSFLRLQERIDELPKEERGQLPTLLLGAEVAWTPNMDEWEALPQLCMGKSSLLLLELPFYPWDKGMFHQLYDLIGKTGVTPVIAHLERYMRGQRWSGIQEILALGVPIQLSSGAFLTMGGRRLVRQLLHAGMGFLLASDCHNATTRPPNMGEAVAVIRKKFSKEVAGDLQRQMSVVKRQLV